MSVVPAVSDEPRRAGEAGFSMIEVLVSMVVSTLLIAMLAQVTMMTMRAARFAETKSFVAGQERTAVERMTMLLRTAVVPSGLTTAVTAASFDSVSFYTALRTNSGYSDPLPTLVQYYWNPATSCFTEALTPAQPITPVPTNGPVDTWSAPLATTTSRCLIRMATDPTAAAPLFTYYGATTVDNSGNSPTPIAIAAGGVSAANLLLIRAVEITFAVVDPKNTDVPAVMSDDKVTLDNLVLAAGGRA